MKRRDFLKGMSAAVSAIVATGFENVIFAKEESVTVDPTITKTVQHGSTRSCSNCRHCSSRYSVIAKEKVHLYCELTYFCQPVDGDEAETCAFYRACDG